MMKIFTSFLSVSIFSPAVLFATPAKAGMIGSDPSAIYFLVCAVVGIFFGLGIFLLLNDRKIKKAERAKLAELQKLTQEVELPRKALHGVTITSTIAKRRKKKELEEAC